MEVIRDGEGAAEFANVLLETPRSFAGRTAAGIDFAVAQLKGRRRRRLAPDYRHVR